MSKSNELLYVVDERNNPMEPMPRGVVHGSGVWHRTAHIWVLDGKGHVLCQERALEKDLHPGMWECFFGGHMDPGEEYEAGAAREVSEELGVSPLPGELKFWKIYKFADPKGKNNEFISIYTYRFDGEIAQLVFSDNEVQQVAWFKITDVIEHLRQPDQKTWVCLSYELDMLDELRK
jgi:isopentenyldiphosphate isomerase